MTGEIVSIKAGTVKVYELKATYADGMEQSLRFHDDYPIEIAAEKFARYFTHDQEAQKLIQAQIKDALEGLEGASATELSTN